METHSYRSPTLTIVVAAVVAMVLGVGFLALKEGKLMPGGAPETSAAPKTGVCFRCGVIESIRSIDKEEIAKASAVAIRGLGADLMSVMAVVAGAITGNRPWANADGTPLHEVTIRFEDGSSRIFKTLESKWERGDRVKVVQGRIYTQPPVPAPSLSFDTNR